MQSYKGIGISCFGHTHLRLSVQADSIIAERYGAGGLPGMGTCSSRERWLRRDENIVKPMEVNMKIKAIAVVSLRIKDVPEGAEKS
jgi:hypothetical protein